MKNTVSDDKKMPALFYFMTPCPLVKEFIKDEQLFSLAEFSNERMLNINSAGMPLYCALSKTPPTSCYTPGKYVPGGYTPSGKYKQGHNTQGKMDKRAGK